MFFHPPPRRLGKAVKNGWTAVMMKSAMRLVAAAQRTAHEIGAGAVAVEVDVRERASVERALPPPYPSNLLLFGNPLGGRRPASARQNEASQMVLSLR